MNGNALTGKIKGRDFSEWNKRVPNSILSIKDTF